MTIFLQDGVYNSFMNIIYLDTLFLMNAILDYFALLCTAILSGAQTHRLRIAVAGIVGGIYACLCVMPDWIWLISPAVKLSAGILMCVIAFGSERHLFVCCAVFFLISAVFGGLFTALGLACQGHIYIPIDFKVLVLTFAGSYALLKLMYQYIPKTHKQEYGEVEVQMNGKTAFFVALHDTGNELSDPISGLPVIICDASIMQELLPQLNWADYKNDPLNLLNTSQPISFRLIPYKTISGTGMLVGFKPDQVKINNHEENMCIAISSTSFSSGKPYSGIY